MRNLADGVREDALPDFLAIASERKILDDLVATERKCVRAPSSGAQWPRHRGEAAGRR